MNSRCGGSLRRDGMTPAKSCRTRARGRRRRATPPPPPGPCQRLFACEGPVRDGGLAASRREHEAPQAVAGYVAEWPSAVIVGESRHAAETIVWLELRRAVAVEAAEQFVRECAHYVAGTFAGLGG